MGGTACELLGSLARGRGPSTLIVGFNGIQLILHATAIHADSSTLQVRAWNALWQLGSNMPGNAQLIGSSGGLDAALLTMDTHVAVAEIQAICCWVIWMLAGCTGAWRVAPQALPSVRRAQVKHHDSPGVQRASDAALRILSK